MKGQRRVRGKGRRHEAESNVWDKEALRCEIQGRAWSLVTRAFLLAFLPLTMHIPYEGELSRGRGIGG